MWGITPVGCDRAPGMSRGRVVTSLVTPPGGGAWDSPLRWVSWEPQGHTRVDPSRGAQGEEHPTRPPGGV